LVLNEEVHSISEASFFLCEDENMPYPLEHAARMSAPDQYDRMRRENDKFGEGIDAIWGIKGNKVELQAIRFDKKKFTVTEAKKWLKDNDYKPILFEPAKKETNNMLQRVTVNFSSPVRKDKMEGRDYIVVPMVMLTEGVHAGSNGPLYYPPDELSKSVTLWDHKPIIVYHPQVNGGPVSACDPDILTNRKVGVILHSKYEDGKLKAEAWMEPDRIKVVDSRILDSIENNQKVEVSTGLFTDNEPEEGEWKTETYSAIARNYRPDHLAILPDLKGACSIEDGAGLLQNQVFATNIMDSKVIGNSSRKETLMDDNVKKMVDALIADKASGWTEEDREFLSALPVDKLQKIIGKAKTPLPSLPSEEDDEYKKKKDKEDEEIENSVQTIEDYINAAPEGMRDVLKSGLAAHNEERAKFIKTITANKANVFSEEDLKAKGLQELKAIAVLASQKPVSYRGQGEVITDNKEEPLVAPSLTFDK